MRGHILRIILLLVIVGRALPAAAEVRTVDASELARCAAIAGGNERLACYDALAVVAAPGIRIAPATVAAPTEGTARTAAAAGPAAQGSGPTATVPDTQPEVGGPAAAGQAGPTRSTNPDDPANFGLTRQQLKVAPAGPQSIKATVSQITENRLNQVSLVLDNGQTWGFTEPDPRVRPGDTVTIKRAALGSYLMTTPSRRSYRVERLR